MNFNLGSRGVEITQFMSYIWQAGQTLQMNSAAMKKFSSEARREAKQKRYHTLCILFYTTERWLSCAMIGLLWLNPLCIMPDVLQCISRDTLVYWWFMQIFFQEHINVVRFVRVIQTAKKLFWKKYKVATKKNVNYCEV